MTDDERPVEPSEQLMAWLGPVRNGFKPKGALAGASAEQLAGFFKVSLWEYRNVLEPLIAKRRRPWNTADLYEGDAWSAIGEIVLALKPALSAREVADRIHEIAETIT